MPSSLRPLLPLALALLAGCPARTRPPAASLAGAAAVADVSPIALYADATLGIEVAQGELRLPARFESPRLAPAPGETGVAAVYLVRPKEPATQPTATAEGDETAPPAAVPGPDDLVTWQVLALRRHGAARVALELTLARDAAPLRIGWAIGAGAPGTRDALSSWATRRLAAQDVFGAGEGPLQRPLLDAAVRAYGALDGRRPHLPGEVRVTHGRSWEAEPPSLLALLGGRAAVDETLQLERGLVDDAADARPDAEPVAFEEVRGIEIAAHPWRDLLAGRTAPRIPLADCVPPDRALFYLPHPREALDELESGGAAFLQRVSSFARQGMLDYAVVARALDDLGLGDGLGRRLLRAGAIREAAIFTSDLALLSGTEVTVVAELSPAFEALLPLEDGETAERSTPGGGKAFTARRGARVFLSTSRDELGRALALQDAGGVGSLGRSDELAVVLLQLAPTDRTRGFAYLSDPFLRRLLGPAQRIGQLRQARARAEMEELAAAALLRRQDVPDEAPTVAGLKRMGYLPPEFPEGAYTVAPDGRVASPVYGPLERPWPIARLKLDGATAAEAAAYDDFRDTYSRYWRRYFDPIAARLDAGADGTYALETFILPLVDDSSYRELAKVLAPTAKPSPAPRWTVPMVTELGFRLSDETIGRDSREISRNLSRELGIEVDVARLVRPNVRVAFPDAAPILQVGADAFGVAGARTVGPEALGVAFGAAFTRPFVLAVELADPAVARRVLDRLPAPPDRPIQSAGGPDVRVWMLRDPDGRVVLSFRLFGVLTFRTTVRIEDRWLVLTNDATLPPRLVAGTEELPAATASATLRPGALRAGLTAAWESAVEAEGDATFSAQHWLAPWLAGGASVAEAQAASRALLGVAPAVDPAAFVPAPNHRVEHRRLGTRAFPLLPSRDPSRDFGLFEGVRDARVDLSFEGDGLRTRVTWSPLAR